MVDFEAPREKSTCLLLQSHLDTCFDIYQKVDRYNDQILKR